ncbi:MAG: DNA adenine methylase [Deltaproteobacteria bacterium]|nr:DNA adenine methylase [Deltaproteobacteria bacterium]
MNYPGGKGGVYQRLINLIPPHEVYIETHLGGGAIIRNKKPAKRNIGIEIDPNTIEMWRRASSKVDFELIHDDAIDYLESHHFTGKELVYCDPPYLRKVRKKHYPIFRHEYTVEQHEKLLEVIKSLPCMVMISGYESSLYEESLKGWHSHSFQAACHHGTATEWIWMNYPPPVELHDYRYLGDNFRERERITKITKNWMARLKKKPVLERKALLSAMNSLNEMD